jgi:2-keto-4-pentenoate hydratase
MAIAGLVISGDLLCARVDCWIIIAVDAVEIYRRLSTARRLAKQVEPPSRIYSDFSLAAGYAVARLLDEEMLADGAKRVGTKLAFTNQDVWSQVGLDTPFWSPMYDTTVTETLSVSLAGLVQPRIEPEIILGFRADLPAGAPVAEIGAAVGWAAAGFEIVQCHYPRWEMTPVTETRVEAPAVLCSRQRAARRKECADAVYATWRLRTVQLVVVGERKAVGSGGCGLAGVVRREGHRRPV